MDVATDPAQIQKVIDSVIDHVEIKLATVIVADK
jgi:hypothetical protein